MIPDFLRLHCSNVDDSNRCPTCPRDFIIPLSSIEGIYKDKDGKALFLIGQIHYCPHPECSDKMRFIESNLTFDYIVAMIDGKIENIGDIKMIYSDLISKG